MKRTLMLRNQELLSFEADFASGEVRVLDVVCGADALLSDIGFDNSNLNASIKRLIKMRCLSGTRADLPEILEGFGVRSALELVFKGHGLSLSDQFWYRAPDSVVRWEDVNFFDNDWDATFSSSILKRDYASLATCSPDVPDITTQGHFRKAWLKNKDGIFLLKEANYEDASDLEGSMLAAHLACLLFGQDVYLPLSIETYYGKRYALSPLMISRNEELIQGRRLMAFCGIRVPEGKTISGEVSSRGLIDIFAGAGIADAPAYAAKVFAFRNLALISDLHAGNYGVIRNLDTGARRAAPPFDYDFAFGFPPSNVPRDKLVKNPEITFLLCAMHFSNLDPSLDWSWYKAEILAGFEDCIKERLARLSKLPPGFAETIVWLFKEQRKFIEDTARKSACEQVRVEGLGQG